MLSDKEFITLYVNATDETRQAVNEILHLKGKHNPDAVRQALSKCGMEQNEINEAMRIYNKQAIA